MSNIVEQINDGIKSTVATAVGVDWSELNYVIDVEKNDFKTNRKRYGVHPLEMDTVPGILKHYNVDHVFEVILTHDYINMVNDTDQRAKTFLLYDKFDEIYKDLFRTKAGLPAIVLNIGTFSAQPPEYLTEDSIAILRTRFTVTYRQSIM